MQRVFVNQSSTKWTSTRPCSGIYNARTYAQLASKTNTVLLGLGSNLGNRLKSISDAIDRLCRPIHLGGADGKLLDTGFLYESDPMYVLDQPKFLNSACKISTPLGPTDLLKVIKQIEESQGRQLSQGLRNGPRPIDLDILFFNSETIDQDHLKIPHVAIPSRQFVLEPLADMAPDLVHPKEKQTILSLLRTLKSSTPSTVERIHPIGDLTSATKLELTKRTHLMSIVNCTPDSFSDGGRSFSLDDAIINSLGHLANGADILDIGGMSTRPDADDVCVDEEIRRTVPLIEALRKSHEVQAHISIDSFRSETAEAAVRAGASIINDVSGGQADQNMMKTVARLNVPWVMMHMRGTSKTMNKMANYRHADVVSGVREELEKLFGQAIEAGIKRWNIIIDPGIGFAKDLRGNCQLINSLDQLRSRSSLRELPMLVGPSRKTFIGQLLAEEPSKATVPPQGRLMGTAAACALSIMHGARILRVHDTAPMREVMRTIDGIISQGSR